MRQRTGRKESRVRDRGRGGGGSVKVRKEKLRNYKEVPQVGGRTGQKTSQRESASEVKRKEEKPEPCWRQKTVD